VTFIFVQDLINPPNSAKSILNKNFFYKSEILISITRCQRNSVNNHRQSSASWLQKIRQKLVYIALQSSPETSSEPAKHLSVNFRKLPG